MREEKLNYAFDMPLESIEDTIGYRVNGERIGYDRVIPMKALVRVDEVTSMKREVSRALIKNIPLRQVEGEETVYPYAEADIRTYEMAPEGFLVGQTFTLDKKVIALMTSIGVKGMINGFDTPGLSKMPSSIVYGRDVTGEKAVALYIPPIVEVHEGRPVLIDGMHRNRICGAAGTSVRAVHIYGASAKLPFEPIEWEECKMVSEKPPKNERFKGLEMNLFRDLGKVGIDG